MSIESNLKYVNDRIAKAAIKSGRDANDIQLVAVTKTIDIQTILTSIDLGIYNIGENRVQELQGKYQNIDRDINWHFIGRLQSNKVKDIADKVALIHSLDRLSLAKEINRRGRIIDRQVPVLVQVNISKEATKAGVYEEDIIRFLDNIGSFKFLKVEGIMTMAPHVLDVEKTRPYFARMQKLFQSLSDQNYPNVDMNYLSMGMTNDFEVAIEEGANMVRIGRAIYDRPKTQRSIPVMIYNAH